MSKRLSVGERGGEQSINPGEEGGEHFYDANRGKTNFGGGKAAGTSRHGVTPEESFEEVQGGGGTNESREGKGIGTGSFTMGFKREL